MMGPLVDVLLATFNGGKYLKEQLASLACQTFTGWRLIVRDDLSEDSTKDILSQFAALYPGKVIILESSERLGVVRNFNALLQASSAPYIAFCDQDDVWDKDKLEIQLNALQKAELAHGASMPLLLHSDLRLVDQYLSPIAPSFWQFSRLFPHNTLTINKLLTQNVVTGCACIFNRALASAALPIPQETLMHDWWLALVAGALGKILIIDKATISYRQHGKNTLGAVKFCSMPHLKKAWGRLQEMSDKKWVQAKIFQERYASCLLPPERDALAAYLSLRDKGWFRSRIDIIRHGFMKQGLLRKSAAMIFLKQP